MQQQFVVGELSVKVVWIENGVVPDSDLRLKAILIHTADQKVKYEGIIISILLGRYALTRET